MESGGQGTWWDTRAQAIQIGALLIFAILIINLSLFQVFVVPDQNGEIEFNHNSNVQDDMLDVRNSVLETASTGVEHPTSVKLGTEYPARTLFVNPTNPGGSLRTESAGTVSVENATATGEAGDYWDGSDRTFDTKHITYQPSYNYYTNAPETVYENSVLYNEFGDGTTLNVTGQQIVNERTLTLVSVQGSLSVSKTGATTVEAEPVSTPLAELPVSAGGSERVTITTPSQLPETTWRTLLADELDNPDDPDVSDPNDDAYVTFLDCSQDPPDPCGTLTLKMEQLGSGNYVLRTAAVSVSGNAPERTETYVVRVTDEETTLAPGETTSVTVEVRDQYNNPVRNVDLDASGAISVSKTTDQNGRATFEYTAPGNPTTETVTVGFDGVTDASKPEATDFTMSVEEASDEDTDGDEGGSADYGTGGTSRYLNNSATTTVSVDNGRYTGIYSTDELLLSGAIPTVDTNNGKKRLEYETALDNGTTTYTVRLRLIKGLSAEDWNTRSVKIFDDSGNSQSATLTKEAAAVINGSQTAYEGTDLLDVNDVAYDDPGSSFERLAAEVRAMDDDGDTTVTALTTTIKGRVNATIRQEALFSAAQPQPSDGAQYQFVRVNFETPTNTTGWEIRYEEGSGTTTLPTRANVGDLSGEIYFAADESAFETQRGLADDVVYPLETSLQDADNLTLVDSSGDRRDELAFEADTDGSPDTTNGWTVSDLGSGEVAVRKTIGEPYRDADRASDWRIATQTSFFGASGPSVAFVPNSNQRLIRTVSNGGTVVDYGTDPNQIGILGPKTDLDDDGQDEVLYIGGNNGQSLRYMESDGSITTLVGSKVRQTSAIGVGDPDGDGLKTVYYAVSNGNKLKRIEVGGSPERVSPGDGNSPVDAKGAIGYADANADGDDDIIYLPSGASNEIAYVDDGSTTTVKIGPPGNRRSIGNGNAVGSPVVLDSDGVPGTELRVPIVDGNQDVLFVDPDTGSFETVNRGSVKPKKTPVTVRNWRGDATKEVLVINGDDNQHLYWIEANTAVIGGTSETGEARGEQVKSKGVR
jgi:hypothetical protein